MRFEIAFTDSHARNIEYYLRRRYSSKAKLAKLCRIAICREVRDEVVKEMEEDETLAKADRKAEVE